MVDEYLRRPRRKPKSKLHQLESPFPVPIQNLTGKKSDNRRWYYYFGNLHSNHISITRNGDLTFLYRLGFFGKGILSRSQPQFEKYRDVLSDEARKQYMRTYSRLEPEDRVPQQHHFARVIEERLRQHAVWVGKKENLTSSSPVVVDGVGECMGPVEEGVLFPQCADLHTEVDNGLVEECSSDSDDPETFVVQSIIGTDISCESVDLSNKEVSNHNNDIDTIRDTSEGTTKDTTNDTSDTTKDTSLDNDSNMTSSSEASEVKIEELMAKADTTTTKTGIITSDKSIERENLKRRLLQPITDKEQLEKRMKLEDSYKLYESLQLTFEEAYFLSYGLGCLSVTDDNKDGMSLAEMWTRFSTLKENFVPMYAAYHHFRSKGWVVRFSKIYGLDFVLYQDGMAFHHASYCVIVNLVHEETFLEDRAQLSWKQLSSMCRINERAGKEVLFCYVVQPAKMADENVKCPSCIKEFKIVEVVMRRWMPEKYREQNLF